MFYCKLKENHCETKQNAVDHTIDVTRDFRIISSLASLASASLSSQSLSADLLYIFTSESLNEKVSALNSTPNNNHSEQNSCQYHSQRDEVIL